MPEIIVSNRVNRIKFYGIFTKEMSDIQTIEQLNG